MEFSENSNLFLKNNLSADPSLSISPDVHIHIGADGAPHAYYRDPLTGDEIEVDPDYGSTATVTTDGIISDPTATNKLTGAWTAADPHPWTIAGSSRGSGKSSWTTAAGPSRTSFSADIFRDLQTFDNIKEIYAGWYPDDPAEFDENTFKELPTKVILEFAEALKRDIEKNKMNTSEDVIEYLRKKGLVV